MLPKTTSSVFHAVSTCAFPLLLFLYSITLSPVTTGLFISQSKYAPPKTESFDTEDPKARSIPPSIGHKSLSNVASHINAGARRSINGTISTISRYITFSKTLSAIFPSPNVSALLSKLCSNLHKFTLGSFRSKHIFPAQLSFAIGSLAFYLIFVKPAADFVVFLGTVDETIVALLTMFVPWEWTALAVGGIQIAFFLVRFGPVDRL